jgi:hypothetical protein
MQHKDHGGFYDKTIPPSEARDSSSRSSNLCCYFHCFHSTVGHTSSIIASSVTPSWRRTSSIREPMPSSSIKSSPPHPNCSSSLWSWMCVEPPSLRSQMRCTDPFPCWEVASSIPGGCGRCPCTYCKFRSTVDGGGGLRRMVAVSLFRNATDNRRLLLTHRERIETLCAER